MTLQFTTSWDDGHPLDLRLAELLDAHGCQGTFYVPLRNREGLPVMDAGQLRGLDARFEIGSHTLSHAYADRLSHAAWAQQVVDGKRALEDQLGHAVQGFCYPGGRAGDVAVATVRAAGFGYARSIVNLRLDAGADRFRLPTTLQLYPHSRAVIGRNWLSAGDLRANWPAARCALGARDWRDRLLRLMHLAAQRDGLFHLWGHSWEIEKHGLWTALDSVLREAARLTPPPMRRSNAEVVAARFGPAV